MAGVERGIAAGGAEPRPLRRVPTRPFALDDARVLDVVRRLEDAAEPEAVASAALTPLLEAGARAAAVVERDGGRVVVRHSAGYDCHTMLAGCSLPLDAGLPVTEAVRTSRTVAQGDGPGWVALPFPRDGALLVSLQGAAPRAPDQLARLQRVAAALGDALRRTRDHQRALHATAVSLPGWELAERSRPHAAAAGGDVLLCLPDGRGGSWLVIADVCGSGLAAADVAQGVRAAFAALVPAAAGPGELLLAADHALRSTVCAGSFVTALAVHAESSHLTLASAGHPAPLLLSNAGPRVLELEPGVPLALETGRDRAPRTAQAELPPDGVLLLYTDGLLDRRGRDGPRAADPVALAGWRSVRDLEQLADEVLAAAAEVGTAGDDVTVLLARRRD